MVLLVDGARRLLALHPRVAARVTGHPLGSTSLLRYLDTKLRPLYGLLGVCAAEKRCDNCRVAEEEKP